VLAAVLLVVGAGVVIGVRAMGQPATPGAVKPSPPAVQASSPAVQASSPTAKATPPPPSCGPAFAVGTQEWPNCATTGVPKGVKLKTMISPAPTGTGDSYSTTIRVPGTVINGVNLIGSIDVWADNVTIENSRITSTNWWGINQRSGVSGLKLLHDTIIGVEGKGIDNGGEDYGVSSSGGSLEVAWTNVSGFGAGIATASGYVHDNYVHDLQYFLTDSSSGGYNHDDAFLSDGGSGLRLVHNTFMNQVPVDKGASASLGLFTDDGLPVTDVLVSDNYIGGGSFSIYPGGGPTSRDVVVTDNVFSTLIWPNGGYYGAVASPYWHYGDGNEWSGNSWADGASSGQPVDP
jgi:hypothetical protein